MGSNGRSPGTSGQMSRGLTNHGGRGSTHGGRNPAPIKDRTGGKIGTRTHCLPRHGRGMNRTGTNGGPSVAPISRSPGLRTGGQKNRVPILYGRNGHMLDIHGDVAPSPITTMIRRPMNGIPTLSLQKMHMPR
jgi:hypothetical protein